MHELSIAQSLLEIVLQQCRDNGYERVETVNVRIGRASGIMPDALLFAYDAIKTDSVAHSSVLNIQEIPVTVFCNHCSREFSVEEEYVFNCPSCNGTDFILVGGRELDIVDMEVSE